MPQPRRASGAVRRDHIERGAFLVEFATPDAPMDMFRKPVPPGLGPVTFFNENERKSAVDQYRTMERKGFRVTADIGCMIPDEQYSTYQQGATVKGHQRTFAFFGQWRPGVSDLRNEFGWPMQPQISHLCHRRSCARPDHLIVEEQWRNLKRNYCGLNGVCDCGNEIKCLRRYQMENQTDAPLLCQSKEEVQAALEGAPSFVVHGADRWANRDSKAADRKARKEKRKRKQALHQHATMRKNRRLSQVASDGAEGDEGAVQDSDSE